jgi:hypothetical protein
VGEKEYEMKTRKVVEARVERLMDANWLWFDPDPDGDGEVIRITQENVDVAAKFYKVPEPFLRMVDDAIRTMANEIVGEIALDLEDIWEKAGGE